MAAPRKQPLFDDDGNPCEGTLIRGPKVVVTETDPDLVQAEKDAKQLLYEQRCATLMKYRLSGRPAGHPNKVSVAIKEFLRTVLDDPRYRAQFKRRMFSGEIAPALEQMAYHYVIGKPRERIDITAHVGVTTLNLERLSDAQLQNVRELLQQTRQLPDVLDVQSTDSHDDAETSG